MAAARSRAELTQRLRDYLAAQQVLEVTTPSLSRYAVTDTQIESLEVHSTLHSQPMYLHTSPEYAMKRLLAAGYPDCYSIARVFRDGEAGRHHQPEFTMVEWYRLGFALRDIVDDTLQAIAHALKSLDLANNAHRLNYCDAFRQLLGVDPLRASSDELAAAANADANLRMSIGNERSDWLDLLMTTHIASRFDAQRLTVMQHFPAEQAALARLCPDNAHVADRFEIYFGSTELANGYVELTDADEQKRRMNVDQRERHRRGRKRYEKDEWLLAAMQHGLPACAGVAMGLERLQMVYDDTDDIRDVITFAFDNST